MQYKIQKPKKEDLNQIDELFEITIRDTFSKEKIVDPLNEDANSEIKVLKNALRIYLAPNSTKGVFLIAKSENKVLGTIAYGKPNHLIQENLKINNVNTPEIKSVYVLPDYQNKGIGTQLFQKILITLKENNIKDFCLDSGYKRAQLYWKKKLGTPQCILKDYWSKGNDHMIWHCRLEVFL